MRENSQLENFGKEITEFSYMENYEEIFEGVATCHALE